MADGSPPGVGPEITSPHPVETASTPPIKLDNKPNGVRRLLDGLKSPLKKFLDAPTDWGKRRTLWALGLGAAAGAATAAGLTVAERSMPKNTIDQRVMVGDQPMHFSAQEFKPRPVKYGNGEQVEIKNKEKEESGEVVLFLVGAPMRAAASVTWAHPQDLADEFKVSAYEVDARPVGAYKGNAIDLEVEAIRDFIKSKKFTKVTIVAHSIGVPKAFELAAILEQNDPDIKVNGIVANNPVGLYEQDKLDILKRYKADGDNQGLEQNRNPQPRYTEVTRPRHESLLTSSSQRPEDSGLPIQSRHESLPKVIAQLVGSMVKDFRDTGVGYKKFLEDQLDVATKVSPYLAQVKAPILFLLSSEDQVAQMDRIFPEELRNPVTNRSQIAARGKERDKYMKDHYAKKSERVMVIEASKFPTHIATTVQRSESSAWVGSRIFDRLVRTFQSDQQKAA